mgnify:CR=1 FL=1
MYGVVNQAGDLVYAESASTLPCRPSTEVMRPERLPESALALAEVALTRASLTSMPMMTAEKVAPTARATMTAMTSITTWRPAERRVVEGGAVEDMGCS